MEFILNECYINRSYPLVNTLEFITVTPGRSRTVPPPVNEQTIAEYLKRQVLY